MLVTRCGPESIHKSPHLTIPCHSFLSGKFKNTQLGWEIIENEAYAVLASFEKVRWVHSTPDGFNLYTAETAEKVASYLPSRYR